MANRRGGGQKNQLTLILVITLFCRELVRFCFMDVLQNDLNAAKHTWNQHRIRVDNVVNSPRGKPDMLYAMPASYGR